MAKLGNANKFYVKVGTATSYTWLTGEQNNSLNLTQEAIEVSDKSSQWAQFIGGKKGATIEATVFTDNDDDEQVEVLKGLHYGDEVDWFIGELGSSTPSEGDAGKAIVTSINETNDFGAVATRTMSLTATGQVYHYPQFQ